jgi:single-stranded DNA-binding protein
MIFSGEVRKPVVREYDGKNILSFQLMKKNYNKDKSAEVSYTWLNVTVFDAKPFQVAQFAEKAFVAGSGEFTLRSYADNDGSKRQSADVRCNSMDVDSAYVEREQGQPSERSVVDAAMSAAKVRKPVDASACGAGGNDEPPFKSDLGADAWG